MKEPSIKRLIYSALHHSVLVAAVPHYQSWAAYIFPVPGVNHDIEVVLWRTEGNKLPEVIARAIFPAFNDVPYHE